MPVELSAIVPELVEHAAHRKQRAIVDRHRAGIRPGRSLIELEVVGCQGRGVHALQRDRLAIGQRDHGIAVAVVGQMALHAVKSVIPAKPTKSIRSAAVSKL